MPRFRVTNTYIVDAANKAEAVRLLEKHGSNLLAYISFKQDDEPKKGWVATVKNQLSGK